MVEFFSLLQSRMENLIDLRFLVPDTSADILGKTTKLKPQTCKTSSRSATTSDPWADFPVAPI